MPTLSAIISTKRKDLKLNQEDVAKYIDMKRATYQKKERDEGFTEDQLKKIAKYLKLDYKTLLSARNKSVYSKHDKEFLVDDAMQFIVERLHAIDQYQKVFLSAFASLLTALPLKDSDTVAFERTKVDLLKQVNRLREADAKLRSKQS